DLAGERAFADTRHVRLRHAENLLDALRSDAEADSRTGRDRARGRDERIRPVIEIEERPLCAFEEHALAVTERTIDEERRVGDVRSDALRECELSGHDLLDVERLELVDALQPDVLLRRGELELLTQDL